MAFIKSSAKPSTSAAERAAAAATDRANRLARRSASTPASDASAPDTATPQDGALSPVNEVPTPAVRTASPLDILAEAAAQANADVRGGELNIVQEAPPFASPTPSAASLYDSPTPVPATLPPQPAAAASVNEAFYVPSTSPSPRRDDFPPLPSPTFEPVLSKAQKRKAKGKGKDKQAARRPSTPASLPSLASSPALSAGELPYDTDDDYAFAADVARATAMSRGARTDADGGASSSRRPTSPTTPRRRAESPAPAPSSPSKRQRADTSGRAVPRVEQGDPAAPRLHRAPRDPLTVDGLPPRGSYTPTPEHGFRFVYGVTEANLFRNLPARQREQWDAVPHPKIIATIAGGNGDRTETTAALREHIANRFNMDLSEVQVGSPGLADGPGPDPSAWLIAGLHIDHAQALLDARALVSDTLTVFFHAYRPPISGFAGTYQGFTIPADEGQLALRIIADAIAADQSIPRFVRAHRDAYPAQMSSDEALAHFLRSIWLQPLQLMSPRGTFTAWNIYFDSPTDREDLAAVLYSLFDRLIINTPFHGQGRRYPRPLRCNICGGHDHPTNLCPTPDAPGYLGVTPATVGARLDLSREILNPRGKKAGRDGKPKADGKGKGRDDRKGGDRRRGM